MTTHDDNITGPTPEQQKTWDEEAKQRWGNTDAYKQSTARWNSYTKEDKERIGAETDANLKGLVAIMDKGPESPEAQKLIDDSFKHLNKYFYDCGIEMFENLGKMLLADDRYAQTYRKYHPDLPEFRTKALQYYCARHRNNAS